LSHLPSYPWKRTAKLSESNSKTFEEIYTALHRPLLLQSTQIPDGSPKLHIKCSECIGYGTHSVSDFSHCYIKWSTIHIASSTISNLLKWPIGTLTRHYSRYSRNKFPVLPLTLKARSKRNLREYSVRKSTSICSV
jgi:hypothetical protein